MKIFLIGLYLVGISWLSSAESIVLNASKWHVGNHHKACTIKNTTENGEEILELTFRHLNEKGYPEARLTLQPTLDLTPYSSLSFQFRYSEASDGGTFAIRDSNWASWQPAITSLLKRGRIPAGEWLNVSIGINSLPGKIKRDSIIQFGLGFSMKKIPENSSMVISIKNLKLVKTPVSGGDHILAAKWNSYIKDYRPDYSDSKALREPPATGLLPQPLSLAKAGKPTAEIIAENDTCSITAAKELQYWLKAISSAELPILAQPSLHGNNKIYLGAKFAEHYTADLKILNGSDGFAIRPHKTNIYIFGATPKGTMNGVFTFLENNSDIIWPRPRSNYNAIYSHNPDLQVYWGNHCERPVSRLRGWGTNFGRNADDEIWMARNRCNYPNGGGGFDPSMVKPRKEWGGYTEYGGGHNLLLFIPPEKYFAANPEFYCLLNGKRQYPKPMEHQVCFTNPEMTAEFIRNALKISAQAPKDIDCLNIKTEDNWGTCECHECLKPLILPDKKKLTVADPAFRSTQFFMFLNKVAEAIYQEYPRLSIGTYAYFFTAVPPQIKPFHSIRVYFCPYVRPNDKYPLFSPVNNPWWERLTGWNKICDKVVMREYFGIMRFPRPLAEVAAWDMKTYMALGIKEITSELTPDWHRKWSNGKVYDNSMSWDMAMIEYWVITRLYWNPEQDVEYLRKYFISRTFREAASPMEKFYGTLRETWFKDSLPSTLGDRHVACTKNYIIDKGLEKTMREYLTEAEKLVIHPTSKLLIENIRRRFDNWLQEAHNIKIPEISVPLNDQIKDFDSPAWANAAVVNDFKVMGQAQLNSKYPTEVKILHDAMNIYFYVICHDPDIAKLHTVEKQTGIHETFPAGDHFEIFFGDQEKTDTYYQFCFDIHPNKFDLNNHERGKWNADWKCITRQTNQTWEATITIPMKEINFNLGKGKQLKAMFMREFFHGDTNIREFSSWGGSMVHQTAQMGNLTLMR